MKSNCGVIEERNRLVVKSNAMVQKSWYDLSAQESKLVLYLISKIQPDDMEFQVYTFGLRDLCLVCGIGCASKNYKNFMDSIQSLADKSFWVRTGESNGKGRYRFLCRWVTDCVINEGESISVSIQLDHRLKPYLLQLKDNFTLYQLENILAMQSKYAIRLYELLLSYAYLGEYTASLEVLRERLGIKPEQYKVYNNFKVRVLDIALAEIVQYTELGVIVKPVRAGHKITGLTFLIDRKDDFDAVRAMMARRKALEKGE